MTERGVGILGAGGQAKEIAAYAKSLGREVDFYALDKQYIDSAAPEMMIDVKEPSAEQLETPVVLGVGAVALRADMVDAWPGNRYDTIIAESAWIAEDAEIGVGTVVAPLSFISNATKIGNHVLINGARVHHNSEIGDFSVICPGVNIAGGVKIGDGVFIGIGATLINGIEVASGTYIGAGAVVTKSIAQENALVFGVPATLQRVREGEGREGWARGV